MIFNPSFDTLTITLSRGFLLITFFMALVGFGISCLVFIYHWRSYGTDEVLIKKAEWVYVGIGALLLFINLFLTLTLA